MADRVLASRYAEAFMDLVQEAGDVDGHVTDLRAAAADLLAHDAALFRVLCNPVFILEERRAVLTAALEAIGPRPLTRNLLHVLLDKHRIAILPDLVEACAEQADARSGRVKVRVDCAEPLSPQLEAEVRTALEGVTGRTVLLDTRVDASLIGGMVARVGGKVYDASLRTRLEDLKHRLINASILPEA